MKTDTPLKISDHVVPAVVLSKPSGRRWRVRQMAEAAHCPKVVARTGLNRLHTAKAMHKATGTPDSRDPETYERNTYLLNLDAAPAARAASRGSDSHHLRAKLAGVGQALDAVAAGMAMANEAGR